MKKIKAAIVGSSGDGGRCSLEALKHIESVEVVAICDPAKASVPMEIAYYNNLEKMLRENQEIRYVVVATPDHLHLEAARIALQYSKAHVFIEKPVATTLEDLRAFLELSKLYPHRLFFHEKYAFARPLEAVLKYRKELGPLLSGSHTYYTMWNCDRIMGTGEGGDMWRTQHAYNPPAGALSHNFMTILLLARQPIVRVRADGRVVTYKALGKYGGFDTMIGALELGDGTAISWSVCLGIKGYNSPLFHRAIGHTLQFRNGFLAYGPLPEADKLVVNGEIIPFTPEPGLGKLQGDWPTDWREKYNIGMMYKRMHEDLILYVRTGKEPLHNLSHGINVAAACILAFISAKQGGCWQELSPEFANYVSFNEDY